MENDFKEIQETFISESTELLEKMETALYALETDLVNNDSINAVFRAIHTIKGTSGMFGFDYIVHFTHDVENLLDLIRDGKANLTHELIKIFLEARDHTQALIEIESSGQTPSESIKKKSQEILDKLKPFFPGSAQVAKTEIKEIKKTSDTNKTGNNNFHITLRPGLKTFENALDPYSFILYLNKFGKIINLITITGNVPTTEDFNPEHCYLSFEIIFSSQSDAETIRKSFDFLEYDSFIRVIHPNSPLAAYTELIETAAINKDLYLSIFLKNKILTETEIEEIKFPGKNKTVHPSSEEIQNSPTLSDKIESSVSTESSSDKAAPMQRETKTLRVESNKIDQLINLVGELVISGANISQLSSQETTNSRLQESSQLLLRLIGDMREYTLKLRMVPIGETFSKFSRIVREVGREVGKEVKLNINGAETELDKTVIEKINDPLVHIIRNAIDHGLELPDEREAAGKNRIGNLTLSAFHDTGSIVIKIEDDGKGLNKQKIMEKAIAKGLLSAGQDYSDSEIFQTIFSPGLSTADKITNISGRGVGLDVVQKNIDALRGTILISSKEGMGTTFTIRLPLTLAIIDGFMVGVAKSLYIIPLDMILECVDLDKNSEKFENITSNNDKSNFINLRGEVLPILRIAEIFNEHGKKADRESIVIVQYGEKKAGLVVDKLYGEIQTVIKPLGKLFDTTKFLSGATILGNGDVAMILDISTLIHQFITEERKTRQVV